MPKAQKSGFDKYLEAQKSDKAMDGFAKPAKKPVKKSGKKPAGG